MQHCEDKSVLGSGQRAGSCGHQQDVMRDQIRPGQGDRRDGHTMDFQCEHDKIC